MLPLTFAGNSAPASISPGMLDGYTAAFAYSMRRLYSNYAGPCIQLYRESDASSQDFYFDSSGNLSIATIASWLGVETGHIFKWYDQSGNGRDAENTDVETTATYSANSLNGYPAALFSGNHLLGINAAWSLSQPYSMGIIGKMTSNSGAIYWQDGGVSSYLRIFSNAPRMYAGTALNGTTVTAGVPYLYTLKYNGASSIQRRNGAQVASGNVGSNNLTDVSMVFGAPTTNGRLMEIFMLTGDQSSHFADFESSMNSYWSVY